MLIRPAIVMFCAMGFVGPRPVLAQAGGATQVASSAPPTASAATVVLLDGKPIGAAQAWGAKPIGEYSLVIPTRQEMMIANLSISETGGKLVATMRTTDADHPIPMDVSVNGTDLVLELKREHGPITMHLQRRGANISGNWVVGGKDSGTLEGIAK